MAKTNEGDVPPDAPTRNHHMPPVVSPGRKALPGEPLLPPEESEKLKAKYLDKKRKRAAKKSGK